MPGVRQGVQSHDRGSVAQRPLRASRVLDQAQATGGSMKEKVDKILFPAMILLLVATASPIAQAL